MVAITLPDDSVRDFDGPVSGADIAGAIGPGLAKAAIAVRVDGELWDLSRAIDHDAAVSRPRRPGRGAPGRGAPGRGPRPKSKRRTKRRPKK